MTFWFDRDRGQKKFRQQESMWVVLCALSGRSRDFGELKLIGPMSADSVIHLRSIDATEYTLDFRYPSTKSSNYGSILMNILLITPNLYGRGSTEEVAHLWLDVVDLSELSLTS